MRVKILRIIGLVLTSLLAGTFVIYALTRYFNYDLVRNETSEETGKAQNDISWETYPRNIIFFLGDGMGINQVVASRYKYYGVGGRLHMERMPFTGIVNTSPAIGGKLITDSAAGATALATGHKTRNLMVGVTPDGLPKVSILEAAQTTGFCHWHHYNIRAYRCLS